MSASTLFDAPGPKAIARQRIFTVVVLVLAAAAAYVVIARLAEKGQLTAAKWTPMVSGEVWSNYLLPGLIGTVQAAVGSVLMAGIFGLVFGVGRLSTVAPVRWISGIVVEFFRAVPVLVMMIFAFWIYSYNHVFPAGQLALAATITGLTPYNGAVIAELIRSGVGSLPKGQREAGLSIGLTPHQTLMSIQLPQALTAMLPALVSQLVVVLKDTALGYQITYNELLKQGSNVGTAYANLLPSLVTVAVMYIGLNYLLTTAAQVLERRINRRGHTAAPVAHANRMATAPPAASELGGDAAVHPGKHPEAQVSELHVPHPHVPHPHLPHHGQRGEAADTDAVDGVAPPGQPSDGS